MLKTILSVTGKPGLYKLISSGKNMVIVESLIDNKRIPIYARDKVVSLGDIAMYTHEDEVPLKDVLSAIKKKENGEQASIVPNSKPEELQKYLESVLPSYDKERVYNADIKKLISWYNLLTSSGIDFEAEEKEIEETEPTTTSEEGEAKAAAKPKAKKETKPKATTPKNSAKSANTKAATTRSSKSMNRKAQ